MARGAPRDGTGRDGTGMATVREKAAALSLGAACSPAARPTGTGRLRAGRGGGEEAALAGSGRWWGCLRGAPPVPQRRCLRRGLLRALW